MDEDPWDRMCDVADHNALSIACGIWDAEVESALVAAMVLAGRESLGLSGLAGVHSLRSKIIAEPEWRSAHTAARMYYEGAVRASATSLEGLVGDIYSTTAGRCGVLAPRVIAVVEQLGGSDLEMYGRLRHAFDAFNAHGAVGAARMIAWRMVHLERAFGTTVQRTPLLRWIERTASTEAEHQRLVTHLQLATMRALASDDSAPLIEAVFTQQCVLGTPFHPELQALVDERLEALFRDDWVSIAAAGRRGRRRRATGRLRPPRRGRRRPGGGPPRSPRAPGRSP